MDNITATVENAAGNKIRNWTMLIVAGLEALGLKVETSKRTHHRYGEYTNIDRVGDVYVTIEFRERSQSAGRFTERYLNEFDVKVCVSWGKTQSYPETEKGLNIEKIVARVSGLLQEKKAREEAAQTASQKKAKYDAIAKAAKLKINGHEYGSSTKNDVVIAESGEYGVKVKVSRIFQDPAKLEEFVLALDEFMATRFPKA